jgi:hypothetical protein
MTQPNTYRPVWRAWARPSTGRLEVPIGAAIPASRPHVSLAIAGVRDAAAIGAVHYGCVGRRLRADQVRWGRAAVEQYILPDLARLQSVAIDEYSIVLRLWRADQHVRSAMFDEDRFERLQELIDGRLQLQLNRQNRRIMFNLLRSLSQAELRVLAGGPDMDGQAISQILKEATQAIVEYGQWGTADRTPGQPIRLTIEELAALDGPGPEILARTIILAAVRGQARTAYRWAGKGMRLRVDPSGRPVLEDASWAWEPDPELRAAMDEYDARRQATSWATPTGMPVRDRQVMAAGAFPWLTVALCSVPVRVRYPRLYREHTTYGYMIVPVNIAERLAYLADWDRELTAMFGVSAAALRRACRALTNAISINLALDQLNPAGITDDIMPLTSSLADANCLAPQYLHEVLAEGSLRAPKKVWIETLTTARSEADEPPSAAEARAFIDAFTSNAGGAQQELRPRLFHELERHTLLLDLSAATEFADLCYLAVVQGKDGRGKLFEKYARQLITERLGLAPPFPFPPGLKLAKLGLEDDEIDFCFRWGNVLVNIDMKAKTRSVAIHRGSFRQVRNRVSVLAGSWLTRVEPRGRVLAELLRARGEPVDAVVNLLCTADVEYVPPGPALRYNGIPRILTAEEIVALVRDTDRWPQVVAAARPAP